MKPRFTQPSLAASAVAKPVPFPVVATGKIGLVFTEYQIEAILVPEALSDQDLAPVFALAHSMNFASSAELAHEWSMEFVACTIDWADARLAEKKLCPPTAAWFQAIH